MDSIGIVLFIFWPDTDQLLMFLMILVGKSEPMYWSILGWGLQHHKNVHILEWLLGRSFEIPRYNLHMNCDSNLIHNAIMTEENELECLKKILEKLHKSANIFLKLTTTRNKSQI